jgi:hypothetical protein
LNSQENFQIVDIKDQPDSRHSELVRGYLRGYQDPHRLYKNYLAFDPWNDSTILVANLLLINDLPVSFGAIQSKSVFPKGFCRINTRHFVFPEFRSRQLNIRSVGRTKDGVLFGGAIIRHQIGICRQLGLEGAFVSRDKGLRSFQYFMEKTVNELLDSTLPKLEVITDFQFNVCGDPKNEVCWHWIAATSFQEKFSANMLSKMPTR